MTDSITHDYPELDQYIDDVPNLLAVFKAVTEILSHAVGNVSYSIGKDLKDGYFCKISCFKDPEEELEDSFTLAHIEHAGKQEVAIHEAIMQLPSNIEALEDIRSIKAGERNA